MTTRPLASSCAQGRMHRWCATRCCMKTSSCSPANTSWCCRLKRNYGPNWTASAPTCWLAEATPACTMTPAPRLIRFVRRSGAQRIELRDGVRRAHAGGQFLRAQSFRITRMRIGAVGQHQVDDAGAVEQRRHHQRGAAVGRGAIDPGAAREQQFGDLAVVLEGGGGERQLAIVVIKFSIGAML